MFFYGVWSKDAPGHHAGHFVYSTTGEPQDKFLARHKIPFNVKKLQGFLPADTPQSKAMMIYVSGWTVVAFGDYTGDSRNGSSAAFFTKGIHTLIGMCEMARKYYPQQMARIEAVQPVYRDVVEVDFDT